MPAGRIVHKYSCIIPLLPPSVFRMHYQAENYWESKHKQDYVKTPLKKIHYL